MQNFLLKQGKQLLFHRSKRKQKTMSNATTTNTALPPMIAIIRVGTGVIPHGTSERRNPLYAHLKRLEAQFGMPFFLQKFEWLSQNDPDYPREYWGKYTKLTSFTEEHHAFGNAVFEWIDADEAAYYPYAASLTLMKLRT